MKKGRPKKPWIEGVQAAMITRGLETDQWMDREEWRNINFINNSNFRWFNFEMNNFSYSFLYFFTYLFENFGDYS